MDSTLLERLTPLREEARARGIPAGDVDRWLALARPCGALLADGNGNGNGPVAGRFGGPAMLPADVPTPNVPLVAALDCAALPEAVTGLPLPTSGQLLFFGYPDLGEPGTAVHVPAGVPVEERPTPDGRAPEPGPGLPEWAVPRAAERHEIVSRYPRGPLRLAPDVSLPLHDTGTVDIPPYWVPLSDRPRIEELLEVWADVHEQVTVNGSMQIGGHAHDEMGWGGADPVAEAAVELVEQRQKEGGPKLPPFGEWTLLARWNVGFYGREGALLHWIVPRQDLAEHRFDRVDVSFDWNP